MSSRFVYIINSRKGKCSFVITNKANLEMLEAGLTETQSKICNVKYINKLPLVVEIFVDTLEVYDTLSIEKQLEIDEIVSGLFTD